MGEFVCSASLMCANLGRLEQDIQELEAAGIDELHFDIMDGSFVPNITLGADFVKMARSFSRIHCNAHLMVLRPERFIESYVKAGADSITVHVEACAHAHRVLNQIREAGASPGIAINPATPLTKLEYLLPLVDRVCVMCVDPGFAGQAMIPMSFERVRILHENIRYHEYPVRIEVDGNINAENAARLSRMGAEIFVLGTSSLFTQPRTGDLQTTLANFTEAVAAQQHLV